MKAIKIILANILFVQFTLANQSFAATGSGPGSTGGGDPVSQEVRAIITSLPGVLRSKGLQYFPEVRMEEFEKVTSGTINIELKENLSVNGAPKAAHFDREQNLIQVSPTEWGKLTIAENPLATKRAIAFHEVLGLMGIEKNDEYKFSNRLIGLEYLSMVGIKGTQNQIVPQDFRDPQVIYWRTNPDSTVTFFHCPNRNVVSTCRMLGTRSYTKQELAKTYKKLFAELQEAQRMNGIKSKFAIAAIVVAIVVIIAAGVIGGFGWVLAGMLAALPGVGIPLGIAASQENLKNELRYTAERRIQAALLKAGAAKVQNFSQIVANVNQMLIDLDANSDLSPGLEMGLK